MRTVIALALAAIATPALANSGLMGVPNWISKNGCYVAPPEAGGFAWTTAWFKNGKVTFDVDAGPLSPATEVPCGEFSCLVDADNEAIAVIADRDEYAMVIQIKGQESQLWSATCEEDAEHELCSGSDCD